MLAVLKAFFADVKGSKQGILIPEELFRSILTSLGSGTIIGAVVLILQAVLDHVVSIFPDPAIASLASIVLTLILDLLRRQTHGDKPVDPTLTPAVVTPSSPTIPMPVVPAPQPSVPTIPTPLPQPVVPAPQPQPVVPPVPASPAEVVPTPQPPATVVVVPTPAPTVVVEPSAPTLLVASPT